MAGVTAGQAAKMKTFLSRRADACSCMPLVMRNDPLARLDAFNKNRRRIKLGKIFVGGAVGKSLFSGAIFTWPDAMV